MLFWRKILKKLIVICGYGLVGEQYRRYQGESDALIEYYKGVFEKLLNSIELGLKIHPLDTYNVVFTGGFTNDYHSGYSEAQTALDYFRETYLGPNTRLELFSRTFVNFLVEEVSTNTYENIIEATKTGDYSPSIEIIGSEYRRFKINTIAHVYFGSFNHIVHLVEHPPIKPRDKNKFGALLANLKFYLSPGFWRGKREISAKLKDASHLDSESLPSTWRIW